MLGMISDMVARYGRNELFSTQMLEGDRVLQLFMAVLEYRHLGLYGDWLLIMERYA